MLVGLPVGIGPDEDLTRFGVRLQAGSHVDSIAHDRVVFAAPGPHATGVDEAGVDAKVDGEAHLSVPVEGHKSLLHLQRGSQGPFGVVLVGLRRAEKRHDLVAHELVNSAAIALDAGDQAVEAGGDQVAKGFGVELLGEGCEAGDIGEEDGDRARAHRRRRRRGRGHDAERQAARMPRYQSAAPHIPRRTAYPQDSLCHTTRTSRRDPQAGGECQKTTTRTTGTPERAGRNPPN